MSLTEIARRLFRSAVTPPLRRRNSTCLMVTQLEDRSLPAAIMGLVYYDANNDGIKNNNEATAPNIPVSYTPVMGGSTVSGNTDLLGSYSFTGIASGSYTIAFTAPTGYSVGTVTVTSSSGSFSGPPSNGSTLISVGTENVNVDAGLVVAGSPPVSPPPPSPPPPPPPPPPIGNSFLVNTTGDLGDAHLGDGLALDSNGKTSLRAAIQEANNNVAILTMIGFDPVVFPGTGTTTITLIDALPAIAGGMNINGPGETALTISGANMQQRGIFSIGGSSITQIYSLTIANGSNLVTGLGTGHGGGIATAGNLLLDHVTIKNCAANDGGGLYQSSTGGTTIINSRIEGNRALPVGGLQGAGGGVYTTTNTIVINGSVITGNQGAKGGGIAIIAAGAVSLSGTDVTYNSATGTGGGIYNSGCPFSMIGGFLTGNSTNGNGGGIQNEGNSTFNQVTIAGNTSSLRGGAINAAAQTTNLTSCTFGVGNSATGGGDKVARLTGATVTPTNCTNFNPLVDIYDYTQ